MSTHNLCFEQKYEKYQRFLSENFQFFGGEMTKSKRTELSPVRFNENSDKRQHIDDICFGQAGN